MNTAFTRQLLIGSAILGLTGVGFLVSNRVSQRFPNAGSELKLKPTGREDAEAWFFYQRAYPTGSIPAGATENAWLASMAAIAPPQGLNSLTVGDQWTSIGPATINGGQIIGPTENPRVTGRIVDIAVHPDPGQSSTHWFVAAASGGIWETLDGGGTWTAKTDAVASLVTNTITIAPSSPQTLFAGITDITRNGMGLLKSTNGGANWSRQATAVFGGRKLSFVAVKVHPTHPNIVLALTYQGLEQEDGGFYKSSDGGATFPIHSLSGAGTALAINPNNFSQQYAAIRSGANNDEAPRPELNGIFRSTDMGSSWTRLNGPWSPVISVSGNGVKIAVAPSDPNTVYIVVPGSGMWKTQNAWDTTPAWETLPATNSGNANADTVLVDPLNANIFYAGGYGERPDLGEFALQRYNHTTGFWTTILASTHVDQHALAAIVLSTPKSGDTTQLLLGNDGGFWTSTNQGGTWTNRNSNLAVVQFYAGSLHPEDAAAALGGSQDNGTELWSGNAAWTFELGGDGGHNAFSQLDPDTWLVSAQYLDVYRMRKAGSSYISANPGLDRRNAAFLAPIKRSPNSDLVLVGSTRLQKSTDFFTAEHPSWSLNNVEVMPWPIGAIAFAPSDADSRTYAFGAGGELRITTEGGDQWSDLDLFHQVPERVITAIAFHPKNASAIYVALSGYNGQTPGHPGHIFKTANSGTTWCDVSPNADVPINSLAIDPFDSNRIFAGADLGVWKTTNGGASWTFMGPASGMPNVPVLDLAFSPVSGDLVAFTHGRGAFKLEATTEIPTGPRLANVSTRLDVGTGDNVLIGGFILGGLGCSSKQIVVRGMGPSIGLLSGFLADPSIELRRADGSLVAANDNWEQAPNANEIPANLRPGHPSESAILAFLEPGAYTLIVRGVSNTTGIGLFEAYDVEPTSPLKLANVSTRGFVETGDHVMIGGFILSGANSRVLMRGMGPSVPVGDTLPNPMLELKDGNGSTLEINDDWREASNAKEIESLGFQPGDDRESVILTTLAPGAYTVILKDANGATGNGLFEAYHLDF